MAAAPIGMPGWPELAFCTASAERMRSVFMASSSRRWVVAVMSENDTGTSGFSNHGSTAFGCVFRRFPQDPALGLHRVVDIRIRMFPAAEIDLVRTLADAGFQKDVAFSH